MPDKKPFIGGFFGLDIGNISPETPSVMEEWRKKTKDAQFFRNARAALAHLLISKKPAKLWLPAYICADILQAPQKTKTAVDFFPSDPVNGIDLAFLQDRIRPGDAVLTVGYGGHPPATALRSFVGKHRDIIWIEDRCQSLQNHKPGGDYLIYSPRKILGVPDGGLLLGVREALEPPLYDQETHEDRMRFMYPALARYEDWEGDRREEWYTAYKNAEKAMSADLRPMTSLTAFMLQNIPYAPLADARKKNAAWLAHRLKTLKNIQVLPLADVPFCVTIITEDAGNLAQHLSGKGIFCARHWPCLASPAENWPAQWDLAQKLLSIPCDHRYGIANMEKIYGCLTDWQNRKNP